MRSAILRILVVALVVGVVLSGDISHAARNRAVASTPSRSFDFTSVVRVPALPPGSRELRLWIPLPYQDGYQTISRLRIKSPFPYRIASETKYRDRYAYLDLDAAHAKAPFDVRITFHATRFEHRIALIPSKSATIQPAAAAAPYLRPDRLVPINGEIGDLSRRETQGATLPLEKARRLYDYVIATMHYDHDGRDWGRGDALWACNSKHGNCTDFHSLFIAMARAAGIPARFEIGFPLPDAAHEGAVTSYHCWAEFYVNGIGWIPIDASEAWKHPENKNYFFGATDANRVMFSLGRDIRLHPAQKGEPLNYFVYPYAELDGKTFPNIKSEYSFRDDLSKETTQQSDAGMD